MQAVLKLFRHQGLIFIEIENMLTFEFNIHENTWSPWDPLFLEYNFNYSADVLLTTKTLRKFRA
jgi:hypothetical protein